MLAVVAAQDASTSAAATTAAGSTATPKCTPAQLMKALDDQTKCFEEKGFDKCLKDAGMDAAKTCACYEAVNSCGAAYRACTEGFGQLTAEQKKVEVDKCVMGTQCTTAQCERMLSASSTSTLVASIPVLVLSALVAARMI